MKEENLITFECVLCFYRWKSPLDKSRSTYLSHDALCDYCKERPYLSSNKLHPSHSLRLLKRRVEVIDQTSLSHLPTIMKHLMLHITLDDPEALN